MPPSLARDGAEFMADFEAECARRGIKLYTLAPRSSELNGAIERAYRTHTDEFYELPTLRLS